MNLWPLNVCVLIDETVDDAALYVSIYGILLMVNFYILLIYCNIRLI